MKSAKEEVDDIKSKLKEQFSKAYK